MITFAPTPSDLWDLEHGNVYEWGINYSLPSGQEITSAELSFEGIRNWNNSANDLYVYLISMVQPGTHRYNDYFNSADSFDGHLGIPYRMLDHYENLPSYAQDLTYSFTGDDLVALNSYMSNGNFGLGFDPDCHFYNDGIELYITTAVPEPASLALLALCSLVVIRRRKPRKQYATARVK